MAEKKEYIERSKVVEYLRSRKGTFYDNIGKSWSAGMEAAARVCEKFPAADVVEVVHSHWVHDINNRYGCYECGERETMSPKKLKNYCPNCGARMDGEG